MSPEIAGSRLLLLKLRCTFVVCPGVASHLFLPRGCAVLLCRLRGGRSGFLCHCVTSLICRSRGWRTFLSCHFVALCLPRGLGAVAWAAHRAQPSDLPPRATELAQPGVQTLAVPRPRAERSRSASVSTRRSGRSVPARSAGIAPIARGANFTPTPRFPEHLHPLDALVRSLAPSAEPPCYGRWVFIPPRGCQRPCLPRPRGPGARTGMGYR
jgi:hypothetical protein